MSLSQILFSTKGRIPRSTYWYYLLAYTGVVILAVLVDSAIGSIDENSGYGLFSGIVSLVGIFAGLAVAIKRCHDRDHSGWFLLISFVPFLNIWVGIELAFLRGTVGENKYGPDPFNKIPQALPKPIQRIKCPYCAELIMPDAILCRYCGKELLPKTESSSLLEVLARLDKEKNSHQSK